MPPDVPSSPFDSRPVGTAGMPLQPQLSQPDPDVLQRHASRTLDPVRAIRFHGQDLQSTVYTGTQLLVRVTPNENEVLQALTEAAKANQLKVKVNEADEAVRQLARKAGIGPEDDQPLVTRVGLVPIEEETGPLAPPDAWRVLQTYRAGFREDRRSREAVQLDHVLSAHQLRPTPYWHAAGTVNPYWHSVGSANPYWHAPGQSNPYWHAPGSGNPYWHGPGGGQPGGLAEYGAPGFGGRTPVCWVGAAPARRDDAALRGRRRPVVAVLDTGVGDHPWLPDDVVNRDPRCDTLPIGLPDETFTADDDIDTNRLTGELEQASGHGTFIAGLIRQKCPDADILAVRVVQPDGFVAEVDLLLALNLLWLRQKLAIKRRRPDELVDIVSMSLGYYHEELGDETFDPLLLAPIRALSRLGVMVVTSAGNDATLRPMFPAAFAPWSHGPVRALFRNELPVIAVGAENPDRSIAMFSNEGPWVSVHRPGAALVSTVPRYDASRSPSLELRGRGQRRRSTIDPDDFTSGFATWSGTSFAAPILAGELAQELAEGNQLAADSVEVSEALSRSWAAVSACAPHLKRPKWSPCAVKDGYRGRR